jgi:hypothetical protein
MGLWMLVGGSIESFFVRPPFSIMYLILTRVVAHPLY